MKNTRTFTADHSLNTDDANYLLLINSASANSINVLKNSTSPIPLGTRFDIQAIGTGITTVVPDSGVTVNSKDGMYICEQYGQISLIKISVDEWLLIGDVSDYKEYVAMLTQSGTGAPTAVVLKNTIGNIVWSRSAVGSYTGTLTGAFTSQKTWCQVTAQGLDGSPKCGMGRADNNSVALGSVNAAGTAADSLLNNTPVLIKVYN